MILQRLGQLQLFNESSAIPGSLRQQELFTHIQEADLIVFLISVDFIASDFWYQLQLQHALVRHHAGEAVFIPIIVRPVDWKSTALAELEPILVEGAPISSHPNPEQAWHHVALTLREVVCRLREGSRPPLALPASTELAASQHPAPPGGGYEVNDYVARPRPELDALTHLQTPGTPAVLLAPQLMGKSLMMRHLLLRLATGDAEAWSAAETSGSAPPPRLVALDLRQLDPEVFASAELFFGELAAGMLAQLEVAPAGSKQLARSRMTPTQKLSHLMESEVLPRTAEDGRLILAIDHADLICDRTPAGSKLPDSFFGLLRVWIERSRTSRIWPRMRLLLAIATSPSYLTRNVNQSPFNVCLPVDVQDFTTEQLESMMRRYDVPSSDENVRLLCNLVGGHPYLIRLALYRCVMARRPLAELLREQGASTVFDDYLLRVRAHLQKLGLYEDLCRIARDPQAAISPDSYQLLRRLGLVQRLQEASFTRYSLRYPIYSRLVRI